MRSVVKRICAFHEIEHIEWPFLILFFILAGASLDLTALPTIGLLRALYVVLRIAGRIVGGGSMAPQPASIAASGCGSGRP